MRLLFLTSVRLKGTFSFSKYSVCATAAAAVTAMWCMRIIIFDVFGRIQCVDVGVAVKPTR